MEVEGDAVAGADDVRGAPKEVRANREGLHDVLDFKNLFARGRHVVRRRRRHAARVWIDEREEGGAVELFHGAELRHGRKKRLRVRVLRMREKRLRIVRLNDFAVAHHSDAVGDLSDDAHVVRDEEDRHADLFLQLLDKREDLRLDSHVKRRRGLVGDEELRAAGKRHGDHHALAHAAGELMRVALGNARGVGDAHELEEANRFGFRLFIRHGRMKLQAFGDLRARREDWVERGHRLLKDHGDFGAADLSHRRVLAFDEVHRGAVAALEVDGAARDPAAARFDEPHDREARDGLAGARLAHERERFARANREGLAAYGRHLAVFRLEFDGEVLHFKNRFGIGGGRRGRRLRSCCRHVVFSVVRLAGGWGPDLEASAARYFFRA